MNKTCQKLGSVAQCKGEEAQSYFPKFNSLVNLPYGFSGIFLLFVVVVVLFNLI